MKQALCLMLLFLCVKGITGKTNSTVYHKSKEKANETSLIYRHKRAISTGQIAVKSFKAILSISNVIPKGLKYIHPIAARIVSAVITVLRIIFDLIVEMLWGTDSEFMSVQKLLSLVRSEIDTAAEKLTQRKIQDYHTQFENFIKNFLFQNETVKKLFHDEVQKILLTDGDKKTVFDTELVTKLSNDSLLQDHLTDLSDVGQTHLIAISIDLGNDKADFEHRKHPASTAVQYSRFAVLDIILKEMLSIILPNTNYDKQVKESAKVHQYYLLKCCHWMGSENEVLNMTSFSAENLLSYGKQKLQLTDNYTDVVAKLSGDQFLGVTTLGQIAHKKSNASFDEADYLHHQDIIALRSLMIPTKYVSITKGNVVNLQECNDGGITPFRKSEDDGHSFICGNSLFRIVSDKVGQIRTCSRVAMYNGKHKYIVGPKPPRNGAVPLIYSIYTSPNLNNTDFDEQSGRTTKFQFKINVKDKACGEYILDRDAAVLKAVDHTGVISIKEASLDNSEMVMSDEGNVWINNYAFRIYKYGSNIDPAHHDPGIVSSALTLRGTFWVIPLILFLQIYKWF